ncbi:alpha-ketoacid dehydrogenase subunit beta [Thermodesulfobacteriota bacterium]
MQNTTLTYGKSINKGLEKALSNERVCLLGEDICDPYGGAFKVTKGLSSKYPERVINTPISESAITGLAAGLSLRGLRPVLEIMFGDFLSIAFDQILSNISKFSWIYNGQVSVPIVIRTPVGGRRGYGPTHSQSTEKFFFGIPGIKIVAPSILHEPGKLLLNSIKENNPVIFIEYKTDYPKSLLKSEDGMIDEWLIKQQNECYPTIALSPTDFEDDQLTVITYGGMFSIVLDAMKKLLYEHEITSEIIIPSLIKPFKIDRYIYSSILKTGKVVIIEEGTLTNGWGAEVVSLISEKCFEKIKAPIRRIAALDLPIANSPVLENIILPDSNRIIEVIKEML